MNTGSRIILHDTLILLTCDFHGQLQVYNIKRDRGNQNPLLKQITANIQTASSHENCFYSDDNVLPYFQYDREVTFFSPFCLIITIFSILSA